MFLDETYVSKCCMSNLPPGNIRPEAGSTGIKKERPRVLFDK
jgi:hypothetical protein